MDKIISLSQFQRPRPRSASDVLADYAKNLTVLRSMSLRSVEVYLYETSRFLKNAMAAKLTADDLVDPRAVLTANGNGEALTKAREDFIGKVGMADVKAYMSLLKERGTAPATLSKIVASHKSFLHHAYRQGLISTDLSKEMEEEIRLPKIGLQPVKVLTRQEVEKLFTLPDLRTLKGRRDMVVLKLGFVQALRREEMATLRLEDIYFKLDQPFVMIHGKGGKVVEAPLREDVYSAIQSYLKYRPKIESSRLIVSAKKPFTPLAPRSIWKLMKTLGMKVGVKSDVHSMRRAALSFTALAGLNERGEAGSVLITQNLARHEHASTAFRYIKDAAQARNPAVLHNPLGRDSKRKEAQPDAVHPDELT